MQEESAVRNVLADGDEQCCPAGVMHDCLELISGKLARHVFVKSNVLDNAIMP